MKTPRKSMKTKIVRIKFTRTYEYAFRDSDLPKPVKRHKLHVALMGCGGKGKPERVIDDGFVMFYAGIGWVREEEVASREDYLKYPRVID